MNARRYVICDIEATGLSDDKEIIEIALITLEDDKVIDVYQTLVNPLRPVSGFIQQFTGVSIRELENAPKFYDIAEAVRVRLEGAVFVSHNTDFDYGLLRRKYQELGQDLSLKTFCTLKVAQEEIPGLSNYNLDALCDFFRIKNLERHRALGDAFATKTLFHELQNLRLKIVPRPLYLPRHERDLEKLTTRAGLLYFKNTSGKVIRLESAANMSARAKELLQVKPENRELLVGTASVEGEGTGSALIAEFKSLLFHPFDLRWRMGVETLANGERSFRLSPLKKGESGVWFFKDEKAGKRKLAELRKALRDDTFAWREGEKSKEEILRQNQKVDRLVREAQFPTPHLVLVGEGRILGERSLVLILDGHVRGYGYTSASEKEIFAHPEIYLSRTFHRNLPADIVAMRYLRVLKNVKNKTETWRALSSRSPEVR